MIPEISDALTDLSEMLSKLEPQDQKTVIEIRDLLRRLRGSAQEWKSVAALLIHGAECQIDDFKAGRRPSNEHWVRAWMTYERTLDR